MNVTALSPRPRCSEPFSRSRERFIPESSGCYVLTSVEGTILYIGLTNALRRRFKEHLDNPEKRAPRPEGRAVLFHWTETSDLNKVERTWLNAHLVNEGNLPGLNKIYSPVST